MHGWSETRAPRWTSSRTIEALIPVSITAIRGPAPDSPWRVTSFGVTTAARSWPAIGGSASISSRASESVTLAGNTPPRIAPASRMWRTSARVSIPEIAATPQSASQSSQPRSALGASSRLQASRMIAARAHGRSDSIAAALVP